MTFKSLHGGEFGFESDNGGLAGRTYGNDINVRINALKRATITSAQLLALFATPITIVAAPPAGYANILNRIVVHKQAGTAYAAVAVGDDLVAKYTNAAGMQISSVIETTGFLDQTTVQTRTAGPPGATGATAGDVTPVNGAIVLHLLLTEVTTGTGNLLVWTFYDTIPLTLTA